MVTIVVLSSDKTLTQKIRKYCAQYDEEFDVIFPVDFSAVTEYLNYEMPEICILNGTDQQIDHQSVLTEIKNDPWLHYGGVILIHGGSLDERELMKQARDVNIIALLRRSGLDFFFPRLLRILNENRSFLFQRDIHALLKSYVSGSFEIHNDPFDLTTYSNLLANFLFNANLISADQKEMFHVGMMELLSNAIEHGNCGISPEEKSKWLAQSKELFDLVREKNKDPQVARKRVHLSYRITPDKSYFNIRDEGQGFDWRAHNEVIADRGLEEMAGPGIAIANLYLSGLTYNEQGNRVDFAIDNRQDESNLVPELFTNMEELVIEDNENIFIQGEKSSYLYYIVAGKYDIIVNGKKISTLTPDDIFLGEMSFLLNNRRSATVRSVGKGVLIKISKEDFINAIKAKPHYGIFLSRLLAQRLVQLHESTK